MELILLIIVILIFAFKSGKDTEAGAVETGMDYHKERADHFYDISMDDDGHIVDKEIFKAAEAEASKANRLSNMLNQ